MLAVYAKISKQTENVNKYRAQREITKQKSYIPTIPLNGENPKPAEYRGVQLRSPKDAMIVEEKSKYVLARWLKNSYPANFLPHSRAIWMDGAKFSSSGLANSIHTRLYYNTGHIMSLTSVSQKLKV